MRILTHPVALGVELAGVPGAVGVERIGVRGVFVLALLLLEFAHATGLLADVGLHRCHLEREYLEFGRSFFDDGVRGLVRQLGFDRGCFIDYRSLVRGHPGFGLGFGSGCGFDNLGLGGWLLHRLWRWCGLWFWSRLGFWRELRRGLRDDFLDHGLHDLGDLDIRFVHCLTLNGEGGRHRPCEEESGNARDRGGSPQCSLGRPSAAVTAGPTVG